MRRVLARWSTLPTWQRVAVAAVCVVIAALAVARLWDALGAFVGALLGLSGPRAVQGARTAVAARRAARTAAELGEAIAEAADAHTSEDTQADAEIRAARDAVVGARSARTRADDLEPIRSEYLGE